MTTNATASDHPIVAHIEAGRYLYGGAQQVLYLIEGMVQGGWQPLLICPCGAAISAPAKAAGARVVELPMGGDLDLPAIARIRRVLRQHRVDLVHCHSRRGADILGGLAAKSLGLPCVLSRRVDNPEPSWLVPLKYRLFDRVIAISEGIREVLIACGVEPDKTLTVRSAVDFERFQQQPDRASFLARFQLPDDARVLGMAAQLIRRKGHHVLLDALPAVLERHPACHVLIMGQGPLEPDIRAAIQQKGLGDRVVMTGFLEDLPALLPNLEALVHPALAEGLGVILLQAAASGLPIVASRVGGMPEAIRDGETGWLIEPGDSAALTAAMLKLLEDPQAARAMGAAGRQYMAREFSIETMVAGNLGIYQELLARG